MIILNNIFPLFMILVLGKILKHFNITSDYFLKTSDKLVYFIFFPVMLFWKIGGSTSSDQTSTGLCLAAACAVCTVFILSLASMKIFRISSFQAGTFNQACYRFNTYLGMALIMNTLGEPGVRHFGILCGLIIPIINVFAVSTLIWHSGDELNFQEKVSFLIKALISNPLIIGCAAGIVYSKFIAGFPIFLNNSFQLMTSVTLPLALISIGGTLSFSSLKSNLNISFLASFFKLVALPLAGYLFLNMFDVQETAFKTGMIFFALPASTAIYVLSSQLHSDTELASAAIMLSTLLSFFSLSIVLLF